MYEILRWMFDKFTKIRYNKKIKKIFKVSILAFHAHKSQTHALF